MMIIKQGIESEIKVFKIKKWPKVNVGKNTCWSNKMIQIEDIEVSVYWECMRGQSYYFQYKGIMYRAPFYIKKNGLINENANFDVNLKEKYQLIKG